MIASPAPNAAPNAAHQVRRSVSRRPARAALLLLAFLSLAAFGNAFRGDFLYDDFPYIVENPQVQAPTLKHLFGEPLTAQSPQLGLYRPLPVLTYALQAQGRGAEAPSWPFHALNVALHAAVTLLVFLLAQRLGVAAPVALIAGALFAVHPVHVEAVDWIVGRAELLAALFGLAYVVLSLDANREAGRGRRGAAWVCFALACLCKESSFVLPAVVVVLDWMRGARPRLPELVRRHAAEALLLVLLALVRVAVIGRFGPDMSLGPYGHRPWIERLGVAANLLGEYFRRCVVPAPPRIFFHRSEFVGWHAGALIGLALFAAALAFFRRDRGVRAALAVFPLALLTVLNLVPIQETMAERFLYLPSAFAVMALAALLGAPLVRELAKRGRAGLSLLPPIGAVGALLACCWFWNPVFDDALSLWRHNVAQSPDLPFPHYQCAYFLHQKEVWSSRGANDTGALEEYETAVHLNETLVARGEEGMPPDQRIRAFLSLGDIYFERLPAERRDLVKARKNFEAAIKIGEATAQLDAELGKALFLFAQLRHSNVGVSRELARAALREATGLKLADEVIAAVRDDLARLDKE